MKKLVFGLLAAAAIGAAVPASAATIVHERPNGTVVVLTCGLRTIACTGWCGSTITATATWPGAKGEE